ncbi:Ysf3 [Kluyveromyces lactis]|nr:Ysf3 [Kluyveromyces lactis]
MSNKVKEELIYEDMRKKHPGVGSARTTKEEWSNTISKDTYASLAIHQNLLEYYTLASGFPSKRDAQLTLLRKLANPPKPSKRDIGND